jgi:hypothetical protein
MGDVIPVALFAYRRPDLLVGTLESLRRNQVPLIYAFSDGPARAAVSGDVAQVREMLRAVDWTKIEIHASPTNLGVSGAVIGGVDYVLARHEMVAVVEEDLEFVPGTYEYLCAALRRYRTDERVMGVTAWGPKPITPPGVTGPYFSGRISSLVWGTYRRAWAGMAEVTAMERLAECRAKGIDPARMGPDLVDSIPHEIDRGFWDFRFNLQMLARGGVFLWPPVNMVRHNGYEPRATNSPNLPPGWEDVLEPAPDPTRLVWPAVVEHPGSAKLWFKARDHRPPPLIARAWRRLLRVFS